MTHDELRDLGFAPVLHAVSGLFAAAHTVSAVFAGLCGTGTTAGTAGRMMDYGTFCEAVDLASHERLDDRFG